MSQVALDLGSSPGSPEFACGCSIPSSYITPTPLLLDSSLQRCVPNPDLLPYAGPSPPARLRPKAPTHLRARIPKPEPAGCRMQRRRGRLERRKVRWVSGWFTLGLSTHSIITLLFDGCETSPDTSSQIIPATPHTPRPARAFWQNNIRVHDPTLTLIGTVEAGWSRSQIQ
ncbi:hypothetical protein D9619_013516 [Psilocybe cf. subviscida]|uniref:Uncharacterized protein n=1 Tax=Psilocybe cf. subviscida TaxID=2480587 RepID=A0A8H5BIU3_9AGAR|nr:hypothetical protein D9619_013516 [Psilocybe cf. subviscida]